MCISRPSHLSIRYKVDENLPSCQPPAVLSTDSYLNMLLTASFASIVLTALNVVASPTHAVRDSLVTLPFAKFVNVTSPAHLIRHGQARARFLRDKAQAKQQGLSSDAVVSAPAENEAVSYVANVAVGSPATTCASILSHASYISLISLSFLLPDQLIVDTGTMLCNFI